MKIKWKPVAVVVECPMDDEVDPHVLYYIDAFGEIMPTPYFDAIIAEVKEDIRLNRNLSPPIGRNELKAYLNGLRDNPVGATCW